MKTRNLLIIAVLATASVIPQSLFADDDPCEGVTPLTIVVGRGGAAAAIQDIFDHYTDYDAGDVYRICLSPDVTQLIGETLTFTHLPDKEVVISGLNIEPAVLYPPFRSPLFSISGSSVRLVNSKVTCSSYYQIGINITGPNNIVEGTEVSYCGTGIHIAARDILITDADVHRSPTCVNSTGNETIIRGGNIRNCSVGAIKLAGMNAVVESTEVYNSGVCVDILGNGAVVRMSDIHDCSTVGIRITASNVLIGPSDAAYYAAEKNVIRNNEVGIHQVRGSGNKWPYNSIYANGRVCANGIFVPDGSRPVIPMNGDRSVADFLCSRGETDSQISSCQVQFGYLPSSAGEVEFYKTYASPFLGLCQGQDYIARCTAVAGDRCIFDSFNASAILSNIGCGEDDICRFVTIFTGENSSGFSNTFALEDHIAATPVIVMPAQGDALQGVGDESSQDGEIASNAPEVDPPEENLTTLPTNDKDDDNEATLADAMEEEGRGDGMAGVAETGSCSLAARAPRSIGAGLMILVSLVSLLGLRCLARPRGVL